MMMDDYLRRTSQNYHHHPPLPLPPSHHHHHSNYNFDDDLILVENDYDIHRQNYHDMTNDEDDDVKIIEPDQLIEKVKKVVIAESNNEIVENNKSPHLSSLPDVKDVDDELSSTKLAQIERPTNLELSPPKYRINKMHMGLKNMSHNVGAAVTPTNKMEFYQEKPESFGQVKITQPIGLSTKENHHNGDIISPTSSQDSDKSHLTDQGFFDLKFFHNKLW